MADGQDCNKWWCLIKLVFPFLPIHLLLPLAGKLGIYDADGDGDFDVDDAKVLLGK